MSGVLPNERLKWMCHWVWLEFYNWISCDVKKSLCDIIATRTLADFNHRKDICQSCCSKLAMETPFVSGI